MTGSNRQNVSHAQQSSTIEGDTVDNDGQKRVIRFFLSRVLELTPETVDNILSDVQISDLMGQLPNRLTSIADPRALIKGILRKLVEATEGQELSGSSGSGEFWQLPGSTFGPILSQGSRKPTSPGVSTFLIREGKRQETGGIVPISEIGRKPRTLEPTKPNTGNPNELTKDARGRFFGRIKASFLTHLERAISGYEKFDKNYPIRLEAANFAYENNSFYISLRVASDSISNQQLIDSAIGTPECARLMNREGSYVWHEGEPNLYRGVMDNVSYTIHIDRPLSPTVSIKGSKSIQTSVVTGIEALTPASDALVQFLNAYVEHHNRDMVAGQAAASWQVGSTRPLSKIDGSILYGRYIGATQQLQFELLRDLPDSLRKALQTGDDFLEFIQKHNDSDGNTHITLEKGGQNITLSFILNGTKVTFSTQYKEKPYR